MVVMSFATCCNSLLILQYVVIFVSPFSVKVDYGESQHFCDDPVCPDPSGGRAREPTAPCMRTCMRARVRACRLAGMYACTCVLDILHILLANIASHTRTHTHTNHIHTHAHA